MGSKDKKTVNPLRQKYKGVDLKNLKKTREKENREIGSGGNAGYLPIKVGTNRFRIFPAHDPSESFDIMVTKVWLPREKDDGTIGNVPFQNLRAHAGVKEDLAEAYLKGAKEFLQENDDDADEKIETLTHWKTGIRPNNSWVAYAKEVEDGKVTGELSLLEYGKLVRDGMDDVIATEEENEEIATDPYSDPDTGLPLVMKYKPTEKKASDKYKVELPRNSKPIPLSDEDLEELDEIKPLKEVFSGYTETMFDSYVEAIELYDSTNDIGFCDTDEWKEILERISASMKKVFSGSSKDSKKAPKEEPKKSKSTKKQPEPEDEDDDEEEDDDEDSDDDDEEGDQFDEMDRKQLKKFISENDLEVRVKTNTTDDQIREAIREVWEEDDDEEEDSDDEEEDEDFDDDDEEDEDEEESKAPKLEDIKKKLAKNQKKK